MLGKGRKKPRILLLGNTRAALAIARNLSKRGFKLVVGNHGSDQLCQYSNRVSEIWEHSGPEAGALMLSAELKTYAIHNPELVAIIPVTSDYLRMFAEFPALFDHLPQRVSADPEMVIKCLDRNHILNQALMFGIPVAPFASTHSPRDAHYAADREVGYPLTVMPLREGGEVDQDRTYIIRDKEALSVLFGATGLGRESIFLQKCPNGTRHKVHFAAVNGKLMRIAHTRIRRTEKRDGTGQEISGVTLPVDHPVVAMAQNLVKALNYSGVGCAHFTFDKSRSEVFLTDLHPGHDENTALVLGAGIDLAWFNLRTTVLGETSKHVQTSKPGVKYHWLAGDLSCAATAFGDSETGLTGLMFRAVKALILAMFTNVRSTFEWRDMKPSIVAGFRVVWPYRKNKKPSISTQKKPA